MKSEIILLWQWWWLLLLLLLLFLPSVNIIPREFIIIVVVIHMMLFVDRPHVCNQRRRTAGHGSLQLTAPLRAVSVMKSSRRWMSTFCQAPPDFPTRQQAFPLPLRQLAAAPRLHGDPDHHTQNEIKCPQTLFITHSFKTKNLFLMPKTLCEITCRPVLMILVSRGCDVVKELDARFVLKC